MAAALAHQAEVARRTRECQDGESAGAGEDDEAEGAEVSAAAVVITEEPARLLHSIAPYVRSRGPLALAKCLADAATLNKDQLTAVALLAAGMQRAWGEQGLPERMKPVGRIAHASSGQERLWQDKHLQFGAGPPCPWNPWATGASSKLAQPTKQREVF